MTTALQALRANIAANTLTALQQGALTSALDEIIPTFPPIGETGVAAPPSDAADARTWISALYAVEANGGAPLTLTRVVTPNPISALPAPFQPGAGKDLLVIDITPQTTGLLLVSINLGIAEDATGVPAILISYVDNLTAIAGGTTIAPGLIAEPTSTTPAAVAGVGVFAVENPTFNDGTNPHEATLTIASVPVQAVVGHRTGIIIVAKDTSTQNWTAISAAVSVVEI